MSQDIDHILNHISLKKSRQRWRWAAIGLGVIALAAIFSGGADTGLSHDHVARLRIAGLITGDQKTLDLISDVRKDAHAKAVILRIDSPGGTTAGSEALYAELRKLSADKPVVTVMDTVAASGGYIAALATDHLVARGNSITGSIGVIFSFPEVSQLLNTLGVKMEEIKSGDLKAEPSPYKPVSDKAWAYSEVMVQDGFAWFKGLVGERRKLDAATVDGLSDGRVFTGRQALSAKLIDEIGGEDEALAWLQKEKKVDSALEILDQVPPKPFAERLFGASIADTVMEAVGLGRLKSASDAAKLDGLLVLWHPAL
jgi:protease IV